MGDGYFSEAPAAVAQRRMKTGHILRPPSLLDGHDNLYVIRCEGEGCGWFSAPFLKGTQGEEHAQRAAWEHRTEPTLLVAGSSDILYDMRMKQVQDLVAKQGRQR